MLERWRAESGLLAVGIPPQIEPRFPVHELRSVPLDHDELEKVKVRVPAVVCALAPVGRLIAANLADVAHFLEYSLDSEVPQESLQSLPRRSRRSSSALNRV